MIKKILLAFMCFCSVSSFACPKALPTNDAGFCNSFKTAASCHCLSQAPFPQMCKDMSTIYKSMISMYSTLERACAKQKLTTTQECIDNWNCYLRGGIDSQGRACSSTKRAC